MMEPIIIKAFDIGSAWYRAIKHCMIDGYERPVFRGSRKKSRRKETDFIFIEITNPSNRPLIPDVPDGIPPPTSMDYVNRYLAYLMSPYKEEWEDYTYGERMSGMIQIDRVEGQRISALDLNQLGIITAFLKETPETNRGIIAIGKAEDLLLEHPPCMRTIQFKVRYGELHMALYFRSWDAWGGLPANLGALQLLKEYLGKELNVKDGKIFASSMGLHVYSDEWELANKVIGVTNG